MYAANPDIEIINPPNNRDKENLLCSTNDKKSRRGMEDSFEKKTMSGLSSGNKRSFEELNSLSMNSSRVSVKGKVVIDVGRCKKEAKGRLESRNNSFGNNQQNLSEFLKTNLIVIDDNDDTECPTDEVQKKIKSGN